MTIQRRPRPKLNLHGHTVIKTKNIDLNCRFEGLPVFSDAFSHNWSYLNFNVVTKEGAYVAFNN